VAQKKGVRVAFKVGNWGFYIPRIFA